MRLLLRAVLNAAAAAWARAFAIEPGEDVPIRPVDLKRRSISPMLELIVFLDDPRANGMTASLPELHSQGATIWPLVVTAHSSVTSVPTL